MGQITMNFSYMSIVIRLTTFCFPTALSVIRTQQSRNFTSLIAGRETIANQNPIFVLVFQLKSEILWKVS